MINSALRRLSRVTSLIHASSEVTGDNLARGSAVFEKENKRQQTEI